MIQNNLGLVHACAKHFKNKGIEYDDLYGAGCEGLIKAVDRFDTEYGVQFSTYAVPVILGEIKRLFRDGGTVKVSRRLKRAVNENIKGNSKVYNRAWQGTYNFRAVTNIGYRTWSSSRGGKRRDEANVTNRCQR